MTCYLSCPISTNCAHSYAKCFIIIAIQLDSTLTNGGRLYFEQVLTKMNLLRCSLGKTIDISMPTYIDIKEFHEQIKVLLIIMVI